MESNYFRTFLKSQLRHAHACTPQRSEQRSERHIDEIQDDGNGWRGTDIDRNLL